MLLLRLVPFCNPVVPPGGPAWEEIVEAETAKYVLTLLLEFIFISFPSPTLERNRTPFFGTCKSSLAVPGLQMTWKLEVNHSSPKSLKPVLETVGIWNQERPMVACGA